MYPKLVEHKIKNIVNTNLRYCHNIKMKYYNFFYNIFCFLLIAFTIGLILYFKYEKKKDVYSGKMKENQKRDYILYNLRKFQNMNNKEIETINSY
jgi:large-conductance mechanosensitive channel